ncbi:hypothetical protein H5410_060442 [Solanum commersonii]|uniref:Uncharacterized protein n=1 Tax=Solanum commersonii TaxID=4109 RepID=A0A9J5W605_SOLCO|nr:hypothetical protein H5410_060442 [Solanum commersonii]
MQYEINQLSNEQAESMNELLLLCEHLDTSPKRNSIPKGNINPNKLAGDIPLAPSATNISSISLDMVKPESKDKGKSQTIQKDASSSKEEKGTSSTKLDKIISGKPEGKYPAFTRYIYNRPEESGETFGVLGTTSLFPRISIFPNGSPSFTTQLFEFGYLDQVYTKSDLNEISKLLEQLRNSVKTYAQGDGVYCRIFRIAMENYKVLDQDHHWILMTKGKSKCKILKDKILDIELHQLEATEETWKPKVGTLRVADRLRSRRLKIVHGLKGELLR